MTKLIKIDNTYKEWIQSLSERYMQRQTAAAISVNREMLEFYWTLGKEIVELHAESKWGSGFYEGLSHDLQDAIPSVKGLSVTNLKYMKRFYEFYSENIIRPQSVDELYEQKASTEKTKRLTVDEICAIPWGHHRVIIDKCKGNKDKATFFIHETIENNWSRASLQNFISTDLYERKGKAISNFKNTLPDNQSDLAQEITKDPYNFDFLSIRETYDEKELKDALMDNITGFLLELGTGFAFVGREYRLKVGETEQYLDMLFYHIRLKCYVVIEVKVVDFKPEFIGQLGTYVTAVNHLVKSKDDSPTIGLLVCRNKDDILAQYALEGYGEPIGISEYELAKLLPKDFEGSLPTIEEIENELGKRKI